MIGNEREQKVQLAGAMSGGLFLAGLLVLGIALRFWRLSHWAFDSDEIFMLRDSLYPRPSNPRPLLYYVNHYLVAPLVPLDEFGLRLLPAVFGVLAIPAFYFVCRRLLGTRAALLGALLLTVSGLHVYYSQFGRYWSLVFLLTAVYPYAIYIGVRERDRRALGVGLTTGLLASVAHPVSVLLVGGPALWFLGTFLTPRNLAAWWRQRSVRWGALVLVILLAAIAVRFIPILQGWVSSHDKNPGSGQFLLRTPAPVGVKQAFYLLGYVQGWTFSVVLTGMMGIYLLWRGHDRFLARFLTSLAIFPIGFITLASIRTPVSAYYLIPVAPVFFLGAGYFLDRLFAIDWKGSPLRILPATVLALILIEGAPTLVSQYLNGRRYDFKSAARWLQPRLSSGDVVFSDQPVALGYYLPQLEVRRLRFNTAPLGESLRLMRQAGPGAALWIVAPSPGHAFRTRLREGGLAEWIYGNCQLRNSIGTGRVDFRQQYLQVYRCPPAGDSASSS
jgi:mannosyltransferase